MLNLRPYGAENVYMSAGDIDRTRNSFLEPVMPSSDARITGQNEPEADTIPANGNESAHDETPRPVVPANRYDAGDIDLPCAYCGATVLTGWSLSGLERAPATECWSCQRRSVSPRVYARVLAISGM
jgi:hypothetical protein